MNCCIIFSLTLRQHTYRRPRLCFTLSFTLTCFSQTVARLASAPSSIHLLRSHMETLVVLMRSSLKSSSRPARRPAPRIPRYMQRAFADYLSSMARILSDTVNTCTMPHWVITLRPSCGAPRLVASRGCQALTRHFDAFEALFLLRGIIADCVPLIRSYVSYCTYFDHHILEIEWIRLCTHDSNQDSAAFTRSTCFEKDFVWNEHTCINTHFMNVTSHQILFVDCRGKRDRITTFGDDSELGCEWDGWG